MIEIEDKTLSRDLFEVFFSCDYNKCKGVCCIDGDSGAPLLEKELEQIENEFPKIKKYLSKKALDEIDRVGTYVIDEDGDIVTPIIEGNECVYTTFDADGNCLCAFEKAFYKGEVSFQKPISCALYPVRIKQYKDFTAVNYHKWSICKCAIKKGKKEGIPLFRFLENPLKRAFGDDFFTKVEEVYTLMTQNTTNN